MSKDGFYFAIPLETLIFHVRNAEEENNYIFILIQNWLTGSCWSVFCVLSQFFSCILNLLIVDYSM